MSDESDRMRDAIRIFINGAWPARDSVSAKALMTALSDLQRETMIEVIGREAGRSATQVH